jgi:uncharacterized protein YprB with RNaseH-like and TPR domain
MLENINDENVLFLDIETVPFLPSYNLLPEKYKKHWDKKAKKIKSEEDETENVFQKAGIFAEFGKIICISCGFLKTSDKATYFRVKSFYGDNEKEILTGFNNLLASSFNKTDNLLCAHNGKEFDYPYISRRTLINGLKLPKILDIAGKKPWEILHLDTMELWKFGDYKSYTSLDLLATIFNIPTPKDDIDGSMVAQIYWFDKDIERIVTYCQKDVLTVAQLYLRYKGKPLIDKKNVIIV